MSSLRLFLIVAILSAITLVNFIAVVQGYRAVQGASERIFDEQLAEISYIIGNALPEKHERGDAPSKKIAYQIWSAGGALMTRSDNAPETPIATLEEGYASANFNDFRWRIFTRHDQHQRRWIMVAERIDIRYQLADDIALQSVFPFLISLPLVAIIVWLLVGNALRPLRELSDELSHKRADDLNTLEVTSPLREVSPLIDAVNRLLQRLAASFSREQRFSADAAHELRTPIAALKTHVHNLTESLPAHHDALGKITTDLDRLNHVVEQILLLYRSNPEHYVAHMERADLYQVAQQVIGEMYWDIDKKHQSIALEGSSALLRMDVESIKLLLKNLIGNATKYAPEHSAIVVTVTDVRDGVLMSVTDQGPGIAEEFVSRVFDRFYRLGGDRHGSPTSGCGLGLSIVKHIADLHQAEIQLTTPQAHSGLQVSLFFPKNLATRSLIDALYY